MSPTQSAPHAPPRNARAPAATGATQKKNATDDGHNTAGDRLQDKFFWSTSIRLGRRTLRALNEAVRLERARLGVRVTRADLIRRWTESGIDSVLAGAPAGGRE